MQGKQYELVINDTSGSEDNATLRPQWINSSQGFVLVYDVLNSESWDYISEVLEEIKISKELDKLPKDVREANGLAAFPIVLVCNKMDLIDDEQTRQTIILQASNFAKHHLEVLTHSPHQHVFEAAKGKNAYGIFQSVAEQVYVKGLH